MEFRLDVFAWIPQPDVPNPLTALPGGSKRWGPGACGPRFGGDGFVNPPPNPGGWPGAFTYRAKQTLAFSANPFGSPPVVTLDTGVVPGVTTVLTAPRSAGGPVCHSLTPTVKTSFSSVDWNASDRWYEAKLHGEAQDPVPAATAGRMAGAPGAAMASAMTPNLEWDLCIRFQAGTTIPFVTRAAYAMHSPLSLDMAGTVFPATSYGGVGNIVHGTIMVRRFPSYVVYVTVDGGSGTPVTLAHYFADASARNLAEIVLGQTDTLRQLTF